MGDPVLLWGFTLGVLFYQESIDRHNLDNYLSNCSLCLVLQGPVPATQRIADMYLSLRPKFE